MAKRDYYEVLGVDKGADEAQVKRAYRNLAMHCHPDRNPGDADAADKMKEINEAYAILSHPEKRRLYDTYGHAGLEGFTMEDIFGGVDFGSLFREFGLRDFGFGFGESLFDSFFGRRRTTTERRRKAADFRYDLDITLEEVASGGERTIEIPLVETCPACGGSAADKNGLATCEGCGGSGQIVTERRTGFSIFRQITPCGNCRGTGRIVVKPCKECEGKGKLKRVKQVSVHIPPGADSGHAIRLEGEGEPGGGGVEPGDLYVVLNVERHPLFERHGDDIYVAHEVSFAQAALGAKLDDIPGLKDPLELEIPEGTQTGAVFRLRDKGIPHLNDYGRGDEYVIIKVVTPTDLSEEEKRVLREFERLRERHQKE